MIKYFKQHMLFVLTVFVLVCLLGATSTHDVFDAVFDSTNSCLDVQLIAGTAAVGTVDLSATDTLGTVSSVTNIPSVDVIDDILRIRSATATCDLSATDTLGTVTTVGTVNTVSSATLAAPADADTIIGTVCINSTTNTIDLSASDTLGTVTTVDTVTAVTTVDTVTAVTTVDTVTAVTAVNGMKPGTTGELQVARYIASGTQAITATQFYGVILSSSAAAAAVTIYDNTAASGTILMELKTAVDEDSEVVILPWPLDVTTGIYCDLTNGTCIVLYD